jgi:hypothetical protein
VNFSKYKFKGNVILYYVKTETYCRLPLPYRKRPYINVFTLDVAVVMRVLAIWQLLVSIKWVKEVSSIKLSWLFMNMNLETESNLTFSSTAS